MFGELGFGALIALFHVLVVSAFRILRDYEREVVCTNSPIRVLLAGQGVGIDSADSDGATDGSRGWPGERQLARHGGKVKKVSPCPIA